MNTIKYTYVQKDEDMIVCSVVAAAHQQNTWTNRNKKLRWTLSNTHMPIQMMTRSYAVSLLQHVSKTRKQTQTKNNDEHYQIYIFRLKGWYHRMSMKTMIWSYTLSSLAIFFFFDSSQLFLWYVVSRPVNFFFFDYRSVLWYINSGQAM